MNSLLVVALTALVIAPAAARAASGPADLAGTTVVEGARSGYVDVRLGKPVELDGRFQENPTFALEGGGRLGGVVLRQLGPPLQRAAVVAAGRFDPSIFCSDGCTRPLEGTSVIASPAVPFDADRGIYTLAPGDYRLYLISEDGSPARATLRLGGLAGSRRLAPLFGSEARFELLPRRDPLVTGQLSVFGTIGTTKGEGVFFDTALAYHRAHVDTESMFCTYVDDPMDPFAFYPGCPGRDDNDPPAVWFSQTVLSPGPVANLNVGLALLAPGTHGLGGSFAYSAALLSQGWAGVWLGFNGIGPLAAEEPATAPAGGGRPTPHAAPPASPSAPAALELASRRIEVRGRRAIIRVRCRSTAGCRGRLSFRGGRARTVQSSGVRSASVRLRVPAAIARSLRTRNRVRGVLRIGGPDRNQAFRVVLTRRR